ncbi:MAG: aminomethyltransferase family protein [Vicinamibacterales bacterium]
MPVGSPFHPRTHALCESLNYREWSGYYAVSAYEASHEHEYNAIRNGSALIDISPLFKYLLVGRDATRLVNRIITRDATKMQVDQVVYTTWCDERGKVIDDGTVTRLEEDVYRWTAADASLRWFRQNAHGLDVRIDDISESYAALAVQGPTSARLLRAVSDVDLSTLKYFRVGRGLIAGVPVDISRTGYTGDLGYELWIPKDGALRVWDRLVDVGQAFGARPAGMLALDLARVEAGLLLIDVDFMSVRKALIDGQTYSPFEMGLERLVHLDKAPFVGQRALAAERLAPPTKRIVGLAIDWDDIERTYGRYGLSPQVSPIASRTHVPVFSDGVQVGKATTTAWSPTMKRMIAIATVSASHAPVGSAVEIELTVEAVRHHVAATVVAMPFFNPPRKVAQPFYPLESSVTAP